jgi:hypothetical protein
MQPVKYLVDGDVPRLKFPALIVMSCHDSDAKRVAFLKVCNQENEAAHAKQSER